MSPSTNYAPNYYTARIAIMILNEALQADREAISQLLRVRIPCVDALARHPTIQVDCSSGSPHVSPLGLMNGLFGILSDGYCPDKEGFGLITAIWDEDSGLVQQFVCTIDQSPEEPA